MAVALCRGCADLLAVAVRHRDALGDAHAALAGSLLSISSSLHLLLVSASARPGLTLPAAAKSVDRADLLAVAVRHRDAHAALAGSLLSISSSLHLLLVSASVRPGLTLPAAAKSVDFAPSSGSESEQCAPALQRVYFGSSKPAGGNAAVLAESRQMAEARPRHPGGRQGQGAVVPAELALLRP